MSHRKPMMPQTTKIGVEPAKAGHPINTRQFERICGLRLEDWSDS